jgi:hypothetical protein
MKTVLSILLLCSVSVQPSFGFTVLSLPNVKRDPWIFSKDSIRTPEEMESKARENETEIRRFKEQEKTKADRALIEATISLLRPFHLDEIEAILGTRQPIPENYLLPAVFHYGGLTVSAHQDAGESTAAFFPLGVLGGVYVFQFTNRKTISAGAVYLKRDHSYQMDDRKSEAREAARELERPELEAIKAALEKRVVEHSAE